MDRTEWREVFVRQPAHFVVVDSSSPINSEMIKQFKDSLKNVIILCSCMKGSERITCLSLMLMSEEVVHCIFPLQSITKKIHSNVDNLVSIFQDLISAERCSDFSFRQLFHLISIQCQEHFKNITGKDTWLQLTIVTAQNGKKLAAQIETVLKTVQINYIRKIQILSLIQDHCEEEPPSPSLWPDEDSNTIEIVNLECDPYQLENHFKGWLQDCSTDIEHLRLIFRKSANDVLTVKCDFHERLISPDILIQGGQNGLSVDAGFTQYILPNQNKTSSGKVPVYQLDVIGTVNVSGVCESVLYGQPMILIPTRCWKLDWEELESNQQIFLAICQLLKNVDKILVTKRNFQFRYGANHSSTTCSYFLLFPAENNTLLLKPACSREMLLSSVSTELEIPSEESISRTQEYLNVLPNSEVFNPIYHQSGLYNQLNSSTSKRGNKRSELSDLDTTNRFCKASKLLVTGFPTQL